MKKSLSFLVILLMACPGFSQPLKVNQNDLKQLASMMSGEFSSEQQAKSDADYININLRMTPVMRSSQDGYWLYVEQSVASADDKPYRQRIYHLYIQDDTTIVSKVFEIKNQQQYTGGWKDESRLENLSADSLVDRQGCGIYLHKQDKKIYAGSTPGKECLSSYRGAAYATSEVKIYPDKLVSWDRGWNREDKQVWGAEKGGYIFLKQHK
jgi:CpeT protein